MSGVSGSWVYRIAPKIIEMLKPYHDDNMGTQSAGRDANYAKNYENPKMSITTSAISRAD